MGDVTHRSAISSLASGVYAVLSSTGFTTLSGLYKFRVPQGTTCPYTVINNFIEGRQDCMGAPGKDLTFQVHVVSQSPGSEPFTILSKAVELLHYSTAMTTIGSHDVMAVQYETGDSFDEDVDGILTRHAVGIFRAQVWQST